MRKIFFIGICGISMSALAVLMKNDGWKVVGCDRNYKRRTQSLVEHEIEVCAEGDISELTSCDLVVYSSAIKEENKALKKAKKLHKKCIPRGELLGRIANGYEKVIAVAGSHGKTTTTGMIYNILKFAGKEPTLHLGGNLCEEKSNVILGGKEYFVCEACEYFDNFLYLFPYLSVVTNIEREHLDYFKTFENEKKSFSRFKEQSKIVVDSCSYVAKHKRINKFGGVSFDIYYGNEKVTEINLKIGGFYNIQNALFAYEACKRLGISNEIIKIGLEYYLGTQKRFERKKFLGKEVIIDYAHHPTEIESVQKFTKFLNKKTIVIFQPHTYSRTKNFCEDFVKILSAFDKVFLFKTYEAREKAKDGLSALELSKLIQKSTYLSKLKQVKEVVKNSKDDELIIFLGAGDLPEKLSLY